MYKMEECNTKNCDVIQKNIERLTLTSGEKNESIQERKERLKIESNERKKREEELKTIILERDLIEEIVEKDLKILVLCADISSFYNQKWKDVIRNSVKNSVKLRHIFSPQYLEKYQLYYLGKNIPEKIPSRIYGSISGENLLKTGVNKFNIIISEHCPYPIFTNEVLNNINDYLKDGGIFITPFYEGRNKLLTSKFSKIVKDQKYDILCKSEDEKSFKEILDDN